MFGYYKEIGFKDRYKDTPRLRKYFSMAEAFVKSREEKEAK
ncbi:MAG TPA: hypothetical protein PLI45_00300 [Candidatus Woesebacteria bacterium]|nr:hypothetical protein [Candidatus Woesebacteria bacterium]